MRRSLHSFLFPPDVDISANNSIQRKFDQKYLAILPGNCHFRIDHLNQSHVQCIHPVVHILHFRCNKSANAKYNWIHIENIAPSNILKLTYPGCEQTLFSSVEEKCIQSCWSFCKGTHPPSILGTYIQKKDTQVPDVFWRTILTYPSLQISIASFLCVKSQDSEQAWMAGQ